MDIFALQTASLAQANELFNLGLRHGLKVRQEGVNRVLFAQVHETDLDELVSRLPFPVEKVAATPLRTYCKTACGVVEPHTEMKPAAGRSWFYATEVASIYKFPSLAAGVKPVIGIVSFGGGLYGSVDAEGVLTGGDAQAYWSLCGIAPANHPTVVVKPILGAANTPADPATDENTLDVQMVGACVPSANTTIILYIAPNTLANFAPLVNYMLNTPVTVKGVPLLPTTISISWGAPEIYYSSSLLTQINDVFAAAVAKGVNITTATGDNGANDGVGGVGKYTDFPSSSPNVIACGGTNLVCPTGVYDGATVESAWSSGGGGASGFFSRPAYQSSLTGTLRRQTPDVASVADPSTGVLFRVNGQNVVYGGTSVSAPTLAGYLAAINCRVWANPFLYSTLLTNFNDILTGYNGGYFAQRGYDNCTGLGSPKGDLLAGIFTTRVSSVSFTRSTVSLGTGRIYQSTPTIAPAAATNKTLAWTSTNPAIAAVDASGVVTGVAAGSVRITATNVDSGKSGFFTVNVFVTVTGITVSPTTLSLRKGRSGKITATVAPANARNKTVFWSTQNAAIATVNASGTVSAKNRSGTTIITATTEDGRFQASATITVT